MTESLGHVHPTPILPVRDMSEAIEFYRRLGFDVRSYDELYAWVRHRGHEIIHLHAVDGLDPSTNHTAVYLHVSYADAWHESMSAGGAPVDPIADMPWGMREFRFTDPSGNVVRVGHNV